MMGDEIVLVAYLVKSNHSKLDMIADAVAAVTTSEYSAKDGILRHERYMDEQEKLTEAQSTPEIRCKVHHFVG